MIVSRGQAHTKPPANATSRTSPNQTDDGSHDPAFKNQERIGAQPRESQSLDLSTVGDEHPYHQAG